MLVNQFSPVKGVLREIVQSNVPLSFNQVHIIVALHLLSQPSPIGRYRLSDELSVSGTTARTILRRLQKHGFVSTAFKGMSQKGHVLTEKGKALSLQIETRAKIGREPLDLGPLTVGTVDAIVYVPAPWVRNDFNPLEARDSAVSVGADGCTVIHYGEKGLEVGDEVLSEAAIRKLPLDDLQPGDLVHVGTADVFKVARLGAVAASLCSWK
ncbi:MAG: DUF4443 domain-containing protein [Candidatus Hodarchaeota archaeon]